MDSSDKVLAVLWVIGPARVKDKGLDAIFGEFSKNDEFFSEFSCHPNYGDCPALADALRILYMGGCIERTSAMDFFMLTDAAVNYGGKVFGEVPMDKRSIVRELAGRISKRSN